MRVENSFTAVALLASLPLGAIAQPRLPIEMPHGEMAGIAAPFSEKATYVISAKTAAHISKWQSILSGTSSYGERISITATTDEVISSAERTSSELIVELKRVSGLTWAQISEVFDVNARALHYWKVGKPVSAENHQKLGGAVAMLRFIDRGTGEENKLLLLSEARDGKTFLELMKVGEFQSIMDLASKGAGRISFGTSLTEEARARNAFPEFSPSQELSDEAEVELLERPQTRRKKIRRAKV
jgi:hypothetical protein